MKWRWLLLPLAPIAIVIGGIVGLIKHIRGPQLENYVDEDWFEQQKKWRLRHGRNRRNYH